MCRLYAMFANEPTRVDCELVRAQNDLMQQACADVTQRSAPVGWGAVCYSKRHASRLPTIVRHHKASCDLATFSQTVADVYVDSIVTHVRAATVGSVSSLNAHPFTHDEWTFAHYGTIPNFETLAGSMTAELDEHHTNCRLGDTDSELFFLWLLCMLERRGLNSDNIPERSDQTRDVLAEAVATLADRCLANRAITSKPDDVRLNFVLTNGDVTFACRWNNPLFGLVRADVRECELCGLPHVHEHKQGDYRAVLFASDVVTGEPWHAFPNHSLTYVSPNLTYTTESISQERLQRNES